MCVCVCVNERDVLYFNTSKYYCYKCAISSTTTRFFFFLFFFFSLSLCHSHSLTPSLPHSHTLSHTKEYHRRVSYPQNIDLKLSPPRFSRTLLYSLSRPSLVSRTPGSSPRSTLLFVSRTFCVGLSVSSSRGTVRLPCACVKRDARKSSVKSQSATRERKKTTASKEQRDFSRSKRTSDSLHSNSPLSLPNTRDVSDPSNSCSVSRNRRTRESVRARACFPSPSSSEFGYSTSLSLFPARIRRRLACDTPRRGRIAYRWRTRTPRAFRARTESSGDEGRYLPTRTRIFPASFIHTHDDDVAPIQNTNWKSSSFVLERSDDVLPKKRRKHAKARGGIISFWIPKIFSWRERDDDDEEEEEEERRGCFFVSLFYPTFFSLFFFPPPASCSCPPFFGLHLSPIQSPQESPQKKRRHSLRFARGASELAHETPLAEEESAFFGPTTRRRHQRGTLFRRKEEEESLGGNVVVSFSFKISKNAPSCDEDDDVSRDLVSRPPLFRNFDDARRRVQDEK